jgi:hypothetical protein
MEPLMKMRNGVLGSYLYSENDIKTNPATKPY